jgi:hypothetical protein
MRPYRASRPPLFVPEKPPLSPALPRSPRVEIRRRGSRRPVLSEVVGARGNLLPAPHGGLRPLAIKGRAHMRVLRAKRAANGRRPSEKCLFQDVRQCERARLLPCDEWALADGTSPVRLAVLVLINGMESTLNMLHAHALAHGARNSSRSTPL